MRSIRSSKGLFFASALLAEQGVATTKQIDVIATRALGLTIGSFTAMNLTGGNPITAVGLDNYTTKIGPWFRTPDSLKQKVESGERWDTPKRGEQVEVPADIEEKVTRALRGAYFGLCGEILDAGLVSLADFDMALELALDLKPAFRFMNELGTTESLKLVEEYAAANPNFPVPESIKAHGASNTPFDIPVVLRQDVDGVAVLKIRRPKVLNALSQEVFEELQARFAEADADSRVEAIVLTGFGKKAFVSGADVHFLAKIENEAQGVATSRRSQQCLDAIEDTKKPTVCAMNGLAFGGGVELAMACSTRIAKSGLMPFVCQPEVNLGIIPGAGGTQRLPRWIGLERAAEMIRTARPISSEQGLELGLVSELVDDDLEARAITLAKALAAGERDRPTIRREPLDDVPSELPAVDIKFRSSKVDAIVCKALLGGAKLPLHEAIAYEAECFGEVCGTKDMRIGVDNFLQNGPRAKAAFVHE